MVAEFELNTQWQKWIWFWIFIGLWLRLLVIPIAVHDDFVVLNHPVGQIASGRLDIFSDYNKNYSPYTHSNAYPPLYYYIAGFFRYFSDGLSPDLPNWLDRCWSIYQGTDTELVTMDCFRDRFIFRNLFLVKYYYVFFDLLILVILLTLVAEPRKKVLASVLWTLNPIALHSMYGHGQMDLIPASLVLVSLYLCTCRKPGPAVAILSCGMLVKLYPVIFIPIVILLYSWNLKGALKLIFWASGPILLIVGPLYIQTHGEIMNTFSPYEVQRRLGQADLGLQLQKLVFLAGYLGLCYWVFKSRTAKSAHTSANLTRIYSTVLLVLFLGTPVELRYFVWITPLLILLMVRDRTFFWLSCLATLSLLILRVMPQKSLQFGLFTPLLPELFSAFPSLNSLISSVLPTIFIYKVAYRLFLLTVFLIIVWQWWPDVCDRFIRQHFLINTVKSAVIGILAFTTVLLIWGSISYHNALPAGEHFLRFGKASKIKLKSGPGATNENGSLCLPASFEAKADGMYRICCPVTDRQASGILFRLPDKLQFICLADSGQSVESYRNDINFQPVLDSQGRLFELEFLLKGTRDESQYGNHLKIMAYYTWVLNWEDTARLIFHRLYSDKPFFTFLAIALGILEFSALGIIISIKMSVKFIKLKIRE